MSTDLELQLQEKIDAARKNMESLHDLTGTYNKSAGKYEVLKSHQADAATGGAYDPQNKTMYFHESIITGDVQRFINISNHEHIHSQQAHLSIDPTRTSVEDYMRHAIGLEAAAFTGQYDAAFRKSLQGEPQYLKQMKDERNYSEVGEKYEEVMNRHFPDGNIDANSPEFEQARKEAMGAAYSEFYQIEGNSYHQKAYSEYTSSTIKIGTYFDEKSLSLTDERDKTFHLKDKVEDKDLTSAYFSKNQRMGDTDYSEYVDKRLFEDDAYFRKTMEKTGATKDPYREYRGKLERVVSIRPDIKNASIWEDLQDKRGEKVSFEELDNVIEQYKKDKTPPAKSLGFTVVTPEQKTAYMNADPIIRENFNIVEFMKLEKYGDPELAQDYIEYEQKTSALEDERTYNLDMYKTMSDALGKDTVNDYLDMREHFQNAGLPEHDRATMHAITYAELKDKGMDLDPDKILRNMSPALSDITAKTKEYNPLIVYEIARNQGTPKLVSALDGVYEKSAKRLNESADPDKDLQDYRNVSRAIDSAVIHGDTSKLEEIIKDKDNQFAQDAKNELNTIYSQINTTFEPENDKTAGFTRIVKFNA